MDFRIPIFLEERAGIARRAEPVSCGLPFRRGELFDPGELDLLDPAQRRAPLQSKALARWHDGSAQWVLLDFQADVDANRSAVYTVSRGGHGGSHDSRALRVERVDDEWIVDTGAARFFIDCRRFGPFTRVEHSDRQALKSGCRTFARVRATEHLPMVGECSLEAAGPVKASIRLAGEFRNGKSRLFEFSSLLHFFAGSSFVEVKFTIRNPRAARHRGGLWDLGDPASVLFNELRLDFPLVEGQARQLQWTLTPGAPYICDELKAFELYQDSSGGENWDSRNHIDRLGVVSTKFRGYRLRCNGADARGDRASPIVLACGSHAGMAAAIEGFWQNFPKAIEADPSALRLGIFPGQFGGDFELQGGEQKTHTAFLSFFCADSLGGRMDWVHHRLAPRSSVEQYERSGALFCFSAPAPQHEQTPAMNALNGLVDSAVQGPQSFFERREIIDEYGWRHYGDLYADHESAGAEGGPRIAHYNNQYDVIYGALIQYLRGGGDEWFRLMSQLARHVIDIDIYHTNDDRPAFNGGLFWHTEHYTPAGTATHRAYSRETLRFRSRRLCGGGPSNEHNYASGLLHYYYLTGDESAAAAVRGLADWVIAMDDGRRTPWRFIDRRPTGLATATADRDFHGPGRGAANSVNALLDGYSLTRDSKYLAKAEELIRRCVHPNQSIEALGLGDWERRWSYTVFLQTLGKYLMIKLSEGQVDRSYAYAHQCMSRYAHWMMHNEEPYSRHLDRVEIPTETWAAQDIRKAIVFMLAAAFSDGGDRETFRARAEYYHNACVNDLMSFPTFSLTRPVVLLLTNGYLYEHWRTHLDAFQAPEAAAMDFGAPGAFAYQLNELHRVRRRLRELLAPLSRIRSQAVSGLARKGESAGQRNAQAAAPRPSAAPGETRSFSG
jgi:hypothetical protein